MQIAACAAFDVFRPLCFEYGFNGALTLALLLYDYFVHKLFYQPVFMHKEVKIISRLLT